MERTKVNVAVGLFLVLGILALAYLSIRLGKVSFLGGAGYLVSADFPSVGGFKAGSSGDIAGGQAGRVESTGLAHYHPPGVLRLGPHLTLQGRRIPPSQTNGL